MGGDYTRFTFKPSNNYTGVCRQQGRVDLDADWNEQVEIQDRRWRAETIDAMGRCWVSRQTPDAFRIDSGQGILIQPGRMYVDGLLAENHGTGKRTFDAALGEERNTDAVAYDHQHFYPQAPPLLSNKLYLFYLDVWQREITPIKNPQLLEKALGGVDTATRLQTVWQVKAWGVPDSFDLSSASDDTDGCAGVSLPGYLTEASAGRLTTAADAPPASKDPCVISPSGGYRGLENRFYRVEIHNGGNLFDPLDIADPGSFWDNFSVSVDREHESIRFASPTLPVKIAPGTTVEFLQKDSSGRFKPIGTQRLTAVDKGGTSFHVSDFAKLAGTKDLYARPVPTFKWSRDNGSVVAVVEAIEARAVTVASLGRDEFLRFNVGDWVEVLDDHREFLGEPGLMGKIDAINEANRTITLDRDIGENAFAETAEEHQQRHTRLRRWDQKDNVDENGVIRITTDWIDIEEGIRLHFTSASSSGGPDFRTADFWTFAARTADGSIEILDKAPPRGIHHHYCRLALGKIGGGLTDCRPVDCAEAKSECKAGCCTLTVGDGKTTFGDVNDLHQAFENVLENGRVCILPGEHTLLSTVVVEKQGITIQGCGRQTVIVGPQEGPAFSVIAGAMEIAFIDMEVQSEQTAIFAERNSGLQIKGCALQGMPSLLFKNQISLEISGNELSGGGLWVRSGSTDISITGNVIHNGEGPGILLGDSGEVPSWVGWPSLDDFTVVGPSQSTIQRRAKRRIMTSEEVKAADPVDLQIKGWAGSIEGVRIRDNTIENMDGNGITTAYKKDLKNLQDVLHLGSVQDIEIAGNRIVHCVQKPPDCTFPDGSPVGAGILLTGASDVRIHDNHIARNGVNDEQSTDSIAACGIIAGDCSKIALTNNNVVGNGIRHVPNGDDGVATHFQVGVALLYVRDRDDSELPHSDIGGQATAGSEETYVQGTGYAARIHNNVVDCPAGQALIIIGVGPVSVVGNNLVSHQFVMQPSLVKVGEEEHPLILFLINVLCCFACVLIVDVERPKKEALTMVNDNVVSMATTEIPKIDFDRLKQFLKWFFEYFFGYTIGEDYFPLNLKIVRALSSVGILSFDNIIASGNQSAMDVKVMGTIDEPVAIANVTTVGHHVQVSANYFRESIFVSAGKFQWRSYLSKAFGANIATSNMATSTSLVDGPNSSTLVGNNFPPINP